MEKGDKRKRQDDKFTLTVRGDVTVLISKDAVSARNATIDVLGDQITIENVPKAEPAPKNTKYYAGKVYGPVGDGCVQINDWGKRSKTEVVDTRKQTSLREGQTICKIEALDQARVVVADDDLLDGVLWLRVFGKGAVVLPKGQVHRMHITAAEFGTVAGPNARECCWASEAKISASGEAHVSGLKILTDLEAKAGEDATVSLIVTKDTTTRTTGPVEMVRTK